MTSSSDEKDCADGLQRSSIKKKRYSRTRTTSKANSAGETGKSSTADDNDFDERVKEGQSSTNFIIKNKLFKNVVDVETTSQLKSTQLSLTNVPANVHKDSGFSSCFSSQELSSDLAPVKSFASASSQETFCSEYEEIVASKNRGPLHADTMQESKSFESNVSSTITSQSSSLSQASTSSSSTSGIRSSSSCSGPNLFKNVENVPAARVSKRRAYSDTDEPKSQSPILKDIFSLDPYGPCIVCLSHPKDGVFVHKRFLHLCCCYRCAVKIWNKKKRCPICNCKVNNVQKIFVH